MPVTIRDLWFVTHADCDVNMRAPMFGSTQIEREVHRANMERRDGRADWTAVDLEQVILWYGENRATAAVDLVVRNLRLPKD